MGLTRRDFLAQSAAFGALCASPWPSAAAGSPHRPMLVVILLRGGADALHLVAPLGDPNYASARGSLALDRGIPFEGGFAFHPALEGLKGWHGDKRLAVIHAAGFPNPSRSHFDAQDVMEWGIAGDEGRPRDGTGWLARALRTPSREQGIAALAIAPSLPLALRGSASLAVQHPAQLGLAHADRAALQRLSDRYRRSDDPASRAALRAIEISNAFRREDSKLVHNAWQTTGGGRGAQRAKGERSPSTTHSRQQPTPPKAPNLKTSVEHLREITRHGLTPSVVCLESDGWDTHQGQGTARGRFARAARDLGDAMAALRRLHSERELRVIAMSEFGRTVAPNGSGGSDHGHGGVVWVAGASVRGGLYGGWPGLHRDALYEGRDLAIATDTRHILHETLGAHLQAPVNEAIFPGFAPKTHGIFS